MHVILQWEVHPGMGNTRGLFWRFIHSSPEIKIGFYFVLFFLQMVAYTVLFHYLYPILEKKPISWPSSLLFVVETITTVGYGELLPFENQYTILLAIMMMITGITLIFMIVPLLIAPYLTALLRATPPQRTPHELKNHIIIVGYGELTKALVESLMIADFDIVILDRDEKAALEAARLYRKSVYTVWGDYNNPSTWSNIWIKNSGTVIICEDERTAATTILGIREMTRGKIVAVVDKLSFDRYLRDAGAEYVLSPKHITGRILARHAELTAHHPGMLDTSGIDHAILDSPVSYDSVLKVIHIPVMPGSKSAGKTLKEIGLFEKYGFYTLFMARSGKFVFHPGDDEIIDLSSGVFLLGRADRVADLVENEFISWLSGDNFAVIAGFGDVGRSAYHDMTALGISCVVIDQKPQGVLGVEGNAEDEEVLRDARISEARYCIVAINDDYVNIFTTLMARDMNPAIRILARANGPASVDKLYRAGADYVALLPTIGGQVIARVVLSDNVHVILDLPNGHKVIRKHMMKNPGMTVSWVEHKSGSRIIGLEGGNRAIVKPAPDEVVLEGDALIATGDLHQLKKFIRLC